VRVVTEFPRRVRVLRHAWIPLSDGCRLAARAWLPEGAGEAPVPAVLEYIPYRKNDATALRDARVHGYFAGHGYAAVRVDLRGSGDSDGVLRDEYLALEQRDALEVLRWLASRPWCSGRVGIIGKSWGGFNALQIAALRPPELFAVISVASTDDRYADDVHYMGGCLLASDMLAWAATMLAYNARPPDPAVVGQGWRRAWLERMERTPPFVEAWLCHQRRDAYWKHGSVCEDYGAIACPVYMVGGWADGYRSAILRFLAACPGPCKAMIGPWGHVYPHDGAPGPPIGFLQEAVRWWDRWLKDVPNGIMDEPALRVWMQEPVRPARRHDERPGRWLAEPAWPSPNVELRRLALGERELGRVSGSSAALAIRGSQVTGADSGPWCGWGGPSDFPGDQRGDDGRSLTFDSAPLDERIEILGFPVLHATLAADRPRALVAVRLCDVWPDGASTLITSGLLNLTHAAGHERPRALEPGRGYGVAVTLRAIAYAVDVGHRLRLAISPTLWPWAWPSPEPVTLTVHVDDGARLELPVRAAGRKEDPPPHFSCPEVAPTPAYEALGRAGGAGRTIRHDVASGATQIVNDIAYFPPVRLTDSGLEYVERARDVYRIVEDDPLSAWTSSEREIEIARGQWCTRIETVSTLSATTDTFVVTNTLSAYEGERRVLARTWHRAIRRDHV
jgi:uncharacterized protein